MAIEDAAVLGRLFSHLSCLSQVAPLLRAYESLRLPRTAATQASSRLNQHIFHLPDGPDQAARDHAMRAAMEAEKNAGDHEGSTIGNPNQWADKEKNRVQFGYDADEIAERWWTEEGNGLNQRVDKEKNRVQFEDDIDEIAEKWWTEQGTKDWNFLFQWFCQIYKKLI